ncbi:hypothetical protein [Halorhodospira halophila]|uniref:hypothetical protein n=1 Tax=Halorhodospira halophila TaxID=1053 RepID=UPI001911390F|nr:hypothetical protein [Halorhodospira halophila]MBK5942722.1 hypothetical protein [Halorhodospira halophila]
MTTAESDLVQEIAACWDDPLRYVMLAFPWGEPGTPLADQDGPDEWQAAQLRDVRDHIQAGRQISYRDATSSGHGIGKTAETAWLILWFMSTRPHCAGVVTANTQSQLKSKTWRELSIWHKRALNAHWFKWTATRFFAIEAPETWGIDAIPWSENNPEAFAGLHADDVLVIYDEASAIADSIWDVSEGAMTTPGAFWMAYGNPTRTDGRFARCFGADQHRWNTRKVDSRSAKMVNREEIDRWVEDHGEDSDFIRVRVRGEFPRVSASQLIEPEAIVAARRLELGPDVYNRYPLILGVDPARFGDDRSVIIARRGPKSWLPKIYREIDTMELAGHVAEQYREWNADVVTVDGTGVGAGVVDRLREIGIPVVDVQFAAQASDPRQFVNLRAQAWWRTREWIQGECDLADSDELEQDLLAPQYGYDNKLRLQIESKDMIKRRGHASPDAAEALVTTMVDEAIQTGLTGGRTARPVRRVGSKGWT